MEILLLDNDEHIRRSVPRILEVERDHWTVSTASTACEARDALNGTNFDVLISEIRIPDCDGIEWLKQIGQDYPSVLRVVLTGQADQQSLLRSLGTVHQYLTKPCDPNGLLHVLDRLQYVIASVHSRELLGIVGRAGNLPGLPDIAARIESEIASECGSAESVSRILCQDPGLSAQTLQLANSPVFGLRTPVRNIDQAIMVVGMGVVRSIALSQVYLNQTNPPFAAALAQEIYSHSYEVALLARKISTTDQVLKDHDLTFCAALLHDLGKLVLARTFPEKYEQLHNSGPGGGRPLLTAEFDEYGATHAGIGAFLLGMWGLPQEIVEATAVHHDFEKCALSENMACKYVFAANRFLRHNSPTGETGCQDRELAGPAFTRFRDQLATWHKQLNSNGE